MVTDARATLFPMTPPIEQTPWAFIASEGKNDPLATHTFALEPFVQATALRGPALSNMAEIDHPRILTESGHKILVKLSRPKRRSCQEHAQFRQPTTLLPHRKRPTDVTPIWAFSCFVGLRNY